MTPDPGAPGELLAAEVTLRHWRALRVALVHVLAIVGGVCWLAAAWPEWTPAGLRRLGYAGWAGCGFVLVLAALLELRWRSRWRRLMSTKPDGEG
jgi:hypothetical protein